MSNSLIVLLAILVWIPFTLYYFRKEIAGSGSRKRGVSESGEINIEDCLGASKQSSVAKAAKPLPEPAEPMTPEPVAVASVPPSIPTAEETAEELPFYMAAEPSSMEVVPADEEDPDEWAFEEADMQQSLLEEKQLQEVEHDLREPFRSEAEDRRIADELHSLQTYEVFNALREDARLRTQEILAKYPLPPFPEPLPEEAPLDATGMEAENKVETDTAESGAEEEGREGKGTEAAEASPDMMNDFLNNF